MWGWGYSFSMWQMLQMLQMLSKCILPHFSTFFPAQKRYLCTEFQSALKLRKQRKQRKTTQETMSLPIFRQRNQSIKAEFNLLLRSQMPTMLIYAKIAAEYGISEDRVRKIIRSP